MTVEFVSKGKRLYGAFVPTSTSLIYVAFRRPKDLFKGTKGRFITLTAAMQDETACWAIDEAHLRLARKKGAKYVAIWVKALKWIFITDIENYADRTKSFGRNYTSKGGELQRYLPLRFFETRSRTLRI